MEKNLRLTQDTVKKRDDAESVDNESTLSTSSNLEPFANDDLGMVMHVECVLILEKQRAQACKTVHLLFITLLSEMLCLLPLTTCPFSFSKQVSSRPVFVKQPGHTSGSVINGQTKRISRNTVFQRKSRLIFLELQ